MTEDQQFALIMADNDQDVETCRAWFSEATNEELMLLWKTITNTYDTPAMEVMSRLAQLKFCEMWIEKHAKKPTEDMD